MKRYVFVSTLIVLACFIFLGSSAFSAPINQVSYGSLTGTGLITFDDVAGNTVYNNIFESGNTYFGEHFVGQTVSYSGNFDVISGTPTGGSLTLAVGATDQNLYNLVYSPSNVLTGLGPLGYPSPDAIGEGAISLLFDYDQSIFGFQLVGGDNGDATVAFYSRSGSLIDQLILTNITTNSYGFAREGGLFDIAGISIWNTDPAGIGLDNLIFDVPGVPGDPTVVPEPSTFLLLGGGLVGLAFAVRRRKKE